MSIGGMTRKHLEGNIALSRTHIVKQEKIIETLVEQGHEDGAAKARSVLTTMHEHLNVELLMLTNMPPD